MTAQDKLRRALDIFAVNGNVTTNFDTDSLILSINGIPFLPSETHALNILYRNDQGYQNFMELVVKTPSGAEAKRYITPIFDLRSALYADAQISEQMDDELDVEFEDVLISMFFPHMTTMRGV